MDKNLLEMINAAKEIIVKNNQIQKVKEEQLLKEEELNKKKSLQTSFDEKSKAVIRIKELGFNIYGYEDGSENEELGIYYCQYKNWTFKVIDMEDCDIEEGILGMYNPKNIETKEEIIFYCDLYCNNTSENKLNRLIKIMDMGTDNFIETEYAHYLKLEELLRNKGLEVISKDFTFNINDTDGYLIVTPRNKIEYTSSEKIINISSFNKNICYIRVYRDFFDRINLAVTENNEYGKRSNHSLLHNKAYIFNYNKEEDIDELCVCINCFIEEMKGEFGYLEGDKFYNNKNIESFLSSLEKEQKNRYSENRFQFNGRIQKIDTVVIRESDNKINHYKGLEIYKAFKITFNDFNKFQVGDYKQTYNFIFEYNKSKDIENCLLTIETIFSNVNSDKYKETYSVKGSFLDMYKLLTEFIYEIYDINGISLK